MRSLQDNLKCKLHSAEKNKDYIFVLEIYRTSQMVQKVFIMELVKSISTL